MYKVMKRIIDISFAVIFIVIFWWIYLLAYVGIKVSSPGPAIYRARRVGQNGKVFDCYKFRSMRVDSGKVRVTTLQNDDRIFSFGHFIRKTKIDEMPQILNILKGDMSVIGPRPEDVENAEKIYVGPYRRILEVRPGLSSPASLYDYTHGELCDDEETYIAKILPDKLNLELYYVERGNISYDFKIMFRTGYVIAAKMMGKKNFPLPEELGRV